MAMISVFLILSHTTYAVTKNELLKLITTIEKEHNIPSGLLLAVAKTESNLEAYALNIRGRSLFPIDKEAALKTIHKALDSGITNIDIGVTQLNYKWHRHNFDSIEAMLSPNANLKYAATLLLKLKQEHGNWHKALRYYHSARPEHYRQYSRKVVLCWLSNS